MSSYYYSSYTTYGSTDYTTYPSYSSYASYTYTTNYPDYPSQGAVDGSECLNYIYLVWVYFLFYIGAGYPSSYYPYIIATLLDTVPQECGGTAGENTGSGLDNSALSLLSLQQSYPFGGSASGGVSIALAPGQAYGGYGSSGSGSNSLSAYGIQQPQVVVPQGSSYSGYGGVQQGGLGAFGRRRRSVRQRGRGKVQIKKKYQAMQKMNKKQKGKVANSSKRRTDSKETKTAKNNHKERKISQLRAVERTEDRQSNNNDERKDRKISQSRAIERKEDRQSSNKDKRKERKISQSRAIERKEDRRLDNVEVRIENRTNQRKKEKKKNVKKRIKERKELRGQKRQGSRNQRKKKRKEKRKKERKRRSKKIENSLLGKAIPKEKIQGFRKKFSDGKKRTNGYLSFKFLDNLVFPYSESGTLRKDFRQLVKKKVINKLPDYCEEAKIEKSKNVKKDCAKRAKRIRERIIGRLGKKNTIKSASKGKKVVKKAKKQNMKSNKKIQPKTKSMRNKNLFKKKKFAGSSKQKKNHVYIGAKQIKKQTSSKTKNKGNPMKKLN